MKFLLEIRTWRREVPDIGVFLFQQMPGKQEIARQKLAAPRKASDGARLR